jgi:2-isopropylmalate synthase
VIYDAEHFFDGWAANTEYALSTLKAALEAGADRLVLCDTNGGVFPDRVAEVVGQLTQALRDTKALGGVAGVSPAEGGSVKAEGFGAGGEASPRLGIHAHNDVDMAGANTLAALKAGCGHVQGTLVGFGERCGMASLAALIPSLELKLGYRCLPAGKLEKISGLTRKVAEIANIVLSDNMPYVGSNAFSHKAGMHVDAILKVRRSFEHIDPSLVGNGRHFLMSEVGGRSAIAERVKAIAPSVTRDHPVIGSLAGKLKSLEAEGWAFEGADASFELLVARELGRSRNLFSIVAYRVVSEHPTGETIACSHAWVKVLVDGQEEIAAAEGDGPVNAMDGALRRALKHFYPELEQVRLNDYKVRVINSNAATAAKVRVLITSSDGNSNWTTVGVSEDIIDASRAALVDSIEYKLICDREGNGEWGMGNGIVVC